MKKVKNHFKNPLEKLLQKYHQRTKISVSFLLAGLVVLILFLSLTPFKDRLLSQLYPKPKSEAQVPPASEERPKPEFVKGEVLIKFNPQVSKFKIKKEKAVQSLDIEKDQIPFTALDETTLPQSLNTINQKHKIKTIEKVFKGAQPPQQELKKIKQKFAQDIQEGKKKINEEEFLKVDLSRVYKMTFDEGVPVEEILFELELNPEVEYVQPNYIITTSQNIDQATLTPTPTPTPFVRITYPNGGETIEEGQTIRITWQQYGMSACDLYYIPANGIFNPLSAVNPVTGYYDWLVSLGSSENKGKIYIDCYYANGNFAGDDYSDDFFNIVRLTPTPTATPTPTPTPNPIANDPYYSSSGSWGQSYDDLWGLKKIKADQVWNTTEGEGVIVAVNDTGVDYHHPDIAVNIWINPNEQPNNGVDDDGNGYIDDIRGWDFGNWDNDPQDFDGHGTHVAGTIAAVRNNGIGIVGVTPKAKLMPVKGFADNGGAYTADLAAGIVYAAQNGAKVINNSWGCRSRCESNPVAEDAVRIAYNLGSVIIFAAGNNYGDDTVFYSPQNMKETIAVGSTDINDAKSDFSNLGLLLDVSAPGGNSTNNEPNIGYRNILLKVR